MNQQAWHELKAEMVEQHKWASNVQWRMAARHTLRLMLKLEKELKE